MRLPWGWNPHTPLTQMKFAIFQEPEVRGVRQITELLVYGIPEGLDSFAAALGMSSARKRSSA
jgi:hypothetical protein